MSFAMTISACFYAFKPITIEKLIVHIRGLFEMITNKKNKRCRDRMVVGFITTYAINAYHH